MSRFSSKFVLLMALVVILTSISFTAFKIQRVKASETIYIRVDGSVDPPTAPIHTIDNITYTFTSNIDSDGEGIVVERSNITIDGNGYKLSGNGSMNGLVSYETVNVTIQNMSVENFQTGINLVWSSQGNRILNNNVSRCYMGICISAAQWGMHFNCTIEDNVVFNNTFGLILGGCLNNTLRNNQMIKNQYNLWECGRSLSEFCNDIDTSNKINDRPVFHILSQNSLIIDPSTFPEMGYLALINCTNINVENVTLRNNGFGLSMINTNSSSVFNSNLSRNVCGLFVYQSFGNTFKDNNISQNDGFDLGPSTKLGGITLLYSNSSIVCDNLVENSTYGIALDVACNNTLIGNAANNNYYGFLLFYSSQDNFIAENTIRDNENGVLLSTSSNNTFLHNNFIDNIQQVNNDLYSPSICTWNDTLEGNYWSNSYKSDSNYDGISDYEYFIDSGNKDSYPLMGVFYYFNTSTGQCVNVISNSTIDSFQYVESNSTIRIQVSNMTSTQVSGFCRICIPHALMDEPYEISVQGATQTYSNYNIYDNATHRWIYIGYDFSVLTKERSAGVSVGDWFKGTVVFTWLTTPYDDPWCELVSNTEWLEGTICAILDTNVTFELVYHFKNGTSREVASWIDVATGYSNASASLMICPYLLVSSNLTAGESLYTEQPPFDQWVINETVSRTYLGCVIEANLLKVSNDYGWSMTAYYDRQRGVLCEMNITLNDEYTAYFVVSESNAISEFPSLFILPLFMIATLLAVIICRKRPFKK
jgi:parallel beta-helix repeat protein